MKNYNQDVFNADNKKRKVKTPKVKQATTQRTQVRQRPSSSTQSPFGQSSTGTKINGKPVKSFNSKRPAIISLVVVVIILILAMPAIFEEIEYQIWSYNYHHQLDKMEAVEDYTFDIADIANEKGYNDDAIDYITKVTSLDFSNESEYKFTEITDDFVKNKYDDYTLTLKVGTDVAPGVYTIETGEDSYWESYHFDSYYDHSRYVNIPLVEGDVLEVTTYNDDAIDVTLTPQTKYINYEDQQASGLYIYGLSNFNSEIIIDNDGYNSIDYYYNDRDGFYSRDILYDQKAELKGLPGSAFYIIFDDNNR